MNPAISEQARDVGNLLIELYRRLDRLAEQPEVSAELRQYIDVRFYDLTAEDARRFYAEADRLCELEHTATAAACLEASDG